MTRAFPLLLVLAGCASEAPVIQRADSTPIPPDSLIVELPDSGRLWLTEGRIGTASDGTTCREHGIMVAERGAKPRLVPLLYVRDRPGIDWAGHILATLSTNCRPGAVYDIDISTGQPTLFREGGR
jgi:hypothetical protein